MKSQQLTTHLIAGLWVGGLFALHFTMPQSYAAWLQEDRFVEWLTVALFAAAAFLHGRAAVRERRVFDLAVVAFLVFVAGEEFSWGQRLFGFTPPDVFLEHNTQQEFTLHNFADVFGKPKGVLTLALMGYGVVLPPIALSGAGKRLLARIGATPPPIHTAVWFAVAAALLVWYPLDFTGEWVEALAGALFFLSARPAARTMLIAFGGAVVLATALSHVSARGTANHPSMRECARRETAALVQDITRGGAGLDRLHRRLGSIHKRLYTAFNDGYVDPQRLMTYRRIACGKSQEYLLDPWGMPYWMRVAASVDNDAREVQVYSMGPNRRRDSTSGEVRADDVGSRGALAQ